jgi:hypothetical protein
MLVTVDTQQELDPTSQYPNTVLQNDVNPFLTSNRSIVALEEISIQTVKQKHAQILNVVACHTLAMKLASTPKQDKSHKLTRNP